MLSRKNTYKTLTDIRTRVPDSGHESWQPAKFAAGQTAATLIDLNKQFHVVGRAILDN